MGNTTNELNRLASFPGARMVPPIRFWAWIGALLLAVESYFLIAWVTGDAFVPVPSGPDPLPTYMKNSLIGGQVLVSLVWLACVVGFVIRPWMRDGRPSVDGLIVVGCTLVSPWDPLSTSGQYWFTYNSYLVNYGSVISALPINLAPHDPGANVAWPMLFIPTLYGSLIFFAIALCALMRWARRCWPNINALTLVAICYPCAMAMDFALEAIILVPLGFWAFGGGHINVFAGEYYQFPLLNECFFVGAVFTSLACLRFFVDDKGQTFAERGADKLRFSKGKGQGVRFLALMGAVHVIFFATFHLPTYLLGFHSSQWPESITSRSYFTNGVCGPEVDLACPGPGVPITRPAAERPNFAGEFD